MPPTLRGIYHNLRESKYTISNGEVVFFFSSESYLNKFMSRYKDYRAKRRQHHNTDLNMDTHTDIELYLTIEKRGFFARLKRVKVSKEDLFKYSVRKMVEVESPEWVRV